MATAQDVIGRVRKLINDELSSFIAGQRWSDEELLEWITDGQREIVKLKPESNPVTEVFTVVGDLPRQRLDPALSYRLIRVEANGSDGIEEPPEEVDGEVFMHAYGVLNRRGQGLGTYTPNGPWANAGVVSSENAGLDPDLVMYPVLCAEDVAFATALIATFTGTYNGSPASRVVTCPVGARYVIDETVPFHEITSVQITQSDYLSDGFMSAGAKIRTIENTSGFDAVTFYGAVDQSLQATVGTNKPLHGPLGSPDPQDPIDFTDFSFTDVFLFVERTGNPTSSVTIQLNDTPNGPQPQILGAASLGSIEYEFPLETVVLTSIDFSGGSGTAPFHAIGARYRAPE